MGEVAADNSVVHLNASTVVKAILGFLATYYVFHVGYSKPHIQFFAFMQYVFFKDEFVGKKSQGYMNIVRRYDTALKERIEMKKFKKFSV